MEDILSEDFYYRAVVASYPNISVSVPPASNKKRSTRYEESFRGEHKIGFSKRRVADSVKMLLAEGNEDHETRDRLGELSTALIQRLEPPAQADAAANT